VRARARAFVFNDVDDVVDDLPQRNVPSLVCHVPFSQLSPQLQLDFVRHSLQRYVRRHESVHHCLAWPLISVDCL